ncbi:Ig-like domain-containing protein [Pectobacterium betavasculorum]|uniref:Ig-like domain-containing protein n=1 Tax=Pectobacterium betavasculorum TaxID=55207 RepID=UPI00313BF1E5
MALSVGDKSTLNATVLPASATNKAVIWSSSDPTIATVTSGGVVEGVADGTATITATTEDGTKTANSTVAVA